MRVLVVEDEPAIAKDIENALTQTGYVVDVAKDGEEGWFQASTEEYDAIVLDLGLPKLDGLSVVRRLREDASLVPILVLTARGAWLQRVEGIDAGADDYLTKPFEMEELARTPGGPAAAGREARDAPDRDRVASDRHAPAAGDDQRQGHRSFAPRVPPAAISRPSSGSRRFAGRTRRARLWNGRA